MVLKSIILWSRLKKQRQLNRLNWNIGIVECWSNGFSGILFNFRSIPTQCVQFRNQDSAFQISVIK